MSVREIVVLLALALAALSLAAPPAAAQQCTVTAADIQFGNIDVTANTTIDTTTRVIASCTGAIGQTVRICPDLGQGTGGADAGLNPRYMANGASPLAFNLFANAARTVIWGSAFEPGTTVPPIDVVIGSNGTGRAGQTVFARVLVGQRTTPIGLYTATLTGADASARFAYGAGTPCDAMGGAQRTAFTFTVQARVIPRCTISATDLDFGQTGQLAAARDATNRLTIVCTANAPYAVGLDGGLSGATDPTRRRMTRGAEGILYGLYRDQARLQPWGATQGLDTMGAVGTGSTQRFTVFGRVPGQSTPSPGVYSDTVVVTVTY